MNFATVNGGALAGSDYTATNGTLSFAAEEKRKWVSIPILNDALKESNETFRLNLSNPTGDVLGTRGFTTVTIEDNDPGFRLETTNYWCNEGAGELVITVTRGPDEKSPATVDFSTSNLSALAGSDYAATIGTLSFAAEEGSKQFSVPILNDGVKEANETFRLDLSNAVGGVLGTRSNAIV